MVNDLFLVSYVVLWCLVVLLFIAMFLIYRYLGDFLTDPSKFRKSEGPAMSKKAPELLFLTGEETNVRLGSHSEHPTIVMLVAEGCSACETRMPYMQAFAAKFEAEVRTVIVFEGNEDGFLRYREALSSVAAVVFDKRYSLRKAWKISTTPFAVRLDENGTVTGKSILTSNKVLEHFYVIRKSEEPEAERYGAEVDQKLSERPRCKGKVPDQLKS